MRQRIRRPSWRTARVDGGARACARASPASLRCDRLRRDGPGAEGRPAWQAGSDAGGRAPAVLWGDHGAAPFRSSRSRRACALALCCAAPALALEPAGDGWYWQPPQPQGQLLNDVTFGDAHERVGGRRRRHDPALRRTPARRGSGRARRPRSRSDPWSSPTRSHGWAAGGRNWDVRRGRRARTPGSSWRRWTAASPGWCRRTSRRRGRRPGLRRLPGGLGGRQPRPAAAYDGRWPDLDVAAVGRHAQPDVGRLHGRAARLDRRRDGRPAAHRRRRRHLDADRSSADDGLWTDVSSLLAGPDGAVWAGLGSTEHERRRSGGSPARATAGGRGASSAASARDYDVWDLAADGDDVLAVGPRPGSMPSRRAQCREPGARGRRRRREPGAARHRRERRR